MVIVLHTKYLDGLGVGRHTRKLRENFRSALGKGVINLLCVHAGVILIAAVCKHFRRLVEGGRVYHAFGLFAGEHLRLSCSEHGREIQILLSDTLFI